MMTSPARAWHANARERGHEEKILSNHYDLHSFGGCFRRRFRRCQGERDHSALAGNKGPGQGQIQEGLSEGPQDLRRGFEDLHGKPIVNQREDGLTGERLFSRRSYSTLPIRSSVSFSQKGVSVQRGYAMKTRIASLLVMVLAALLAVPLTGTAQSKLQGLAVLKKAGELRNRARSAADLRKAVRKYEEALKLFRKTGDQRGEGVSLYVIASIHSRLGQYDKAMQYYEASLAMSERSGDMNGRAAILHNMGALCRTRGQYHKALEFHDKSLSIWKKRGHLKGEAASLTNIGAVYRELGQNDKAMDVFRKSLEITKRTGDVRQQAANYQNIGGVYDTLGRYDKALEFYNKALPISRKLRDLTSEATILNAMGLSHRNRAQYKNAMEYYEKALGIYRRLGHLTGESVALSNIGDLYSHLGKYDKALNFFKKSLALNRKLGRAKGQGITLSQIGLAYYYWGQYQRAIEYHKKSLAMSKKIGHLRGMGTSLNNIGAVYVSWGQYDKGLEYYYRSLAIDKEIGDAQGQATALRNLGNVYKEWGQYDKAAESFRNSLAICRELKDRNGEGGTLRNLGQVCADWGQYDKAVEFLEKALGLFRDAGLRREEGLTLTDLGRVYAERGEYDPALRKLEEGLAIYREIHVPTGLPKYLIGNLYLDMGEIDRAEVVIKAHRDWRSLGRLCLAKKEFAEAKEQYGKLLRSAEKNRNADNLFVAYTGLGTAYEEMEDNKKAAEYYRKAVEHTEYLRSSLARTEREKFFDVKIGGFWRTAPYEGLARVLMKTNKPIEALKGSEYTKARVFAEAMSKRAEGQKLRVPAEVLKTDEQINDQLAALKKSRQKAFEKQKQLTAKSLEPQIRDLEKKLDAHIRMLREKYPLFAATKYPRPMPLAESALKENEWVLAYDVTDSGVLIYLTRGKELIKGLFKPIPRKKLDALVRMFREPMEVVPGKESLSEKLKSFDFASGRKLVEILLQDILAKLPKDTPLIVVPDDSLGVLPFEILVLNDAGEVTADGKVPSVKGAEFFGDRNPISYYQSITALTLARTYGKGKSQEKKLLVMADPVFQLRDRRAQKSKPKSKLAGVEADMYKNLMVAVEEGELGTVRFNRLPLTGDLARELSTTYKDDSVVYTGLDATKKRFMGKVAPNLSRYRNIVFATHGYFGKNLPGIMEPVLVLSLVPPGTDGFLRLSEVMGLKMNADMVALTACQTGLGRRISGEGVMGMGRAFQYAGGKSVIMSLWSVAEVSSVKLVESFFKHLKEGKSKLEALRLARKEIRDAGYDHPFFWAPFILVGEVD